MKLFEMTNWDLQVSEEVWGLQPFSKILKRDKSKGKEKANKEVLFVYYFCDVKSPYVIITDIEKRTENIKNDVGLPAKWKMDKVIEEAIELYERSSESVIQKLYKQSLQAASDVGDYLANSKEILAERDDRGKPVVDISKITTALGKVPKLMEDLSKAYKQVIKEQEDLEGKKKGSRSFNTFEQGLTID